MARACNLREPAPVSDHDTRRARVPGKLMLCGEYAVLAGAPAIVTCVDRYAEVTATPARGDTARVALRGFDGGRYSYRYEDGVPQWDAPGQAPALVEAVLRTVTPPLTSLAVDSSAFYVGGRKLGLGSSAAVAVALSAALSAVESPDAALDAALAAHRDFQGGRGSGADVRAVAHGGTIVQHSGPDGTVVLPLTWPSGLHLRAVMTRQSAATVDHVARFARWRDDDASAPAHLDRAAAAASRVVAEWQQDDAAAIIVAMKDFTREISGIDRAAGLGYWSGGHEQLAEHALACGVGYKPCGAGGGDFGIAFAMNPDALAAFAACATAAGFALPGLTLGLAMPECQTVPAS